MMVCACTDRLAKSSPTAHGNYCRIWKTRPAGDTCRNELETVSKEAP
jgi:hypothetical protein